MKPARATAWARAPVVFALGFFALAAQTLLFRGFLTVFEGNELAVGAFFTSWLIWVAIGAGTARFWILDFRFWIGGGGKRTTAEAASHNLRFESSGHRCGKRSAPGNVLSLPDNPKSKIQNLEYLSLLYIPAYLLQATLLGNARAFAGVEAYELLPFATLTGLSFLCNAPVSFVTGFLFTLACRWYAQKKENQVESEVASRSGLPVASVYILETLGSCTAGVVATVLLTCGCSGERVFLVTSAVLCSCALLAEGMSGRLFRRGSVCVAALALALGITLAVGFDRSLTRHNDLRAWGRLLPLEAYQGRFTTAQAEYLYGQREGQFLVMAYGGVVEALPDIATASEVMALHMAQHPDARRVLVLGPGCLSVCLRFLELPQIERIMWLNTDPEYPAALEPVLPEPYVSAAARVEKPRVDARDFLSDSQHAFDLILLDVPDATTLVLNRYTTQEFFGLAKSALAENGVLSARLSGAANYLASEWVMLGASTLATAESVFAHVALKPGEESWLFASDSPQLTDMAGSLRDRFMTVRNTGALYPPEAVFALFPPERIAAQIARYREAMSSADPALLLNTDESPKALLYGLLASVRRAGGPSYVKWAPVALHGGLWIGACAIALYGLLRVVYLLKRRTDNPGAPQVIDSLFLLSAAGLAGMSLSIVLMFQYQSRFGSLFLHIGLISASFMLGSFLGSLIIERLLISASAEHRWLLPACLLLHLALVLAIAKMPEAASRSAYVTLVGLCGVFTGAYFPIAAWRLQQARRTPLTSGSVLETLDSVGGAAGAAMTGVFLLPVLGQNASLALLGVLMAVNLAPRCAGAGRRSHITHDAFRRVAHPIGYTLFGLAAFLLITSIIADRIAAGSQESSLLSVAQEMAQGAELEVKQAQLDNGPSFSYYRIAPTAEAPERYVFETSALVSGTPGYGGPISLAAAVTADGTLQDVRIVRSNETPAYLKMLQAWLGRLPGHNVFGPDTLSDVDAVTGATLTSDAVLRTLEAAGTAFASQALKLHVQGPSPASAGMQTDWQLLLMGIFVVAALALHLRPRLWPRRAMLAAVALIGGAWLNLQYSTYHVLAVLGLNVRFQGLTGPMFLIIAIPAITILFGNVYCGYVCPFGALQELIGDFGTARLAMDPSKNVWKYGRAVKYLLLFLLVVLFAWTRDYAVLSADVLSTFFSGNASIIVMMLAGGALLLSFFYRRFWCRNLCPAGAFLALLNGVRVLGRWLPAPRPGKCDLGVQTTSDLDCIRCDRCRHAKQ